MLQVQQISGVGFTSAILLDIQKLQQYSGEPMAAVYADNLLRTMRIMRNQLPFDPYRTHLTSLQLGIKVLIPLESNRHGLFQRLD